MQRTPVPDIFPSRVEFSPAPLPHPSTLVVDTCTPHATASQASRKVSPVHQPSLPLGRPPSPHPPLPHHGHSFILCSSNRILQPARHTGAFHCSSPPFVSPAFDPPGRPPRWGRAPWGEPLPPPHFAASLLVSVLQPPGIVVRCTPACCASSNRCAHKRSSPNTGSPRTIPSAVPFAALIPHFSFFMSSCIACL